MLLVALIFATVIPAADRPPVSFARSGGPALDGVAAWKAPAVDVATLISQDDANWGKPGVPLRIGWPMAIDIVPAKTGNWETLSSGDRLWRLRLDNNDAIWTVLGFDAFRLQDGGVLWIYDATGTTVLGPFTTADVRDHGELWTPPIEGNDIVLELLWPAKLCPPLRTASSTPVSRAPATARLTSFASAARTLATGRWSMPP